MADTAAKQEKTSRRVVALLSAAYMRQIENPLTGQPARGPALARFGEEIDLVPSEERRLDDLNALLPKGAKPEDAQSHHDARVDAYRAERGDQEALQRHAQRIAEARDSGQGDIVDVSYNVESSSSADLAAQMRERQPSADDTVALAEDDPAKARKVLEAERLATGGSPRPQVEQRLQKVIDGK